MKGYFYRIINNKLNRWKYIRLFIKLYQISARYDSAIIYNTFKDKSTYCFFIFLIYIVYAIDSLLKIK